MQIINAALSLGGVGLVFGALTAVASRYLSVENDARVILIKEALPGANCGGCGYIGCSEYAAAIVNNGIDVGLCPVGGSGLAQKIAEIMGISIKKVAMQRAFVICCGTEASAVRRYNYHGEADCNSANLLGGGPKKCRHGCMGYGTCAKICPFEAIDIKDGRAVVNENCTACGVCVDICPKKLIKLVPHDAKYIVACASDLKGAELKGKCSAGCIACGICVKKCLYGAISIKNNLAVIDYSKCKSCGRCAESCPKSLLKCHP